MPFRCLYFRNIENLMMAGRCFSCSHIGLGGPRVMNTMGRIGIATGYAAALCIDHQITPREVGEKHIDVLQAKLGF
ncbi:FAD-dependent oxidoreductase [Pontiella agarivorans]|uniref:FAD-dependent oxidoreductase n=1 Tax=Pontiella agarivorans TaxID=3038953 RepID=UPI0032AEFAF3